MNIFYQSVTLQVWWTQKSFFLLEKMQTNKAPYMSFCKWQIYTLKQFIIHMMFKHENHSIKVIT